MPAIAFDTLKFVKRLRSAGFDEEKAEALSDALKEWYEAGLSDLATKQDIKELELRLRAEMQSIIGDLKLLKWMMGFLLAGVLSLLIKAFFT